MCTYFGSIRFIIILSTSICQQDVQAIRKSFQVVDRCPFNESEWKMRAAHRTCNGSESYHCLLTEGEVSLREQCTATSLFTSGFCPIFTKEGYLQWSPCKDTACPTSSYRSDEVYQYQICYRKTDNLKGKNKEQGSNDSNFVTAWTIIVVAIFLFFVLVLVLVVFYKRNQFGFKDKVQQCITYLRNFFQRKDRTESDFEDAVSWDSYVLLQAGRIDDKTYQKTEKLNELLNYLVHILKVELCVNDVKEKAVIHSKSINEHFGVILIKDLQSIKDINDYSHLDMSLVFALLRNFCGGIEAPSKGWDYEPQDDETLVGADIERIRSMWNKYCDNDFEFKHLDDVYNRMKQRYGTVAVRGDDSVRKVPPKDEENEEGSKLMKDKIQSIQLNPDCTVEKGIVITENVTTALKILKFRNVVILKGVLGCGKTHALKAIQNHFQENKWETAWVKSQDIEGNFLLEKPTIFLCDNLFGKFGASIFSQDAVNKTEKALKEIECSEQETKVVIGIHTHVYDEVKKNLKLNFLHQKNITIEIDNLSEAETLLIFKEQLKKGHCKMGSNCWFKNVQFQSVLDKLSKNQSHIGCPFLSLMYCIDHDLFSDEAFPVNPLHTMIKYFQKKSQDFSLLYGLLVYLMCVQEHNYGTDLEEWASDINAYITSQALENMTIASPWNYIQVVDRKATLAHELLSVVLFKSVFETPDSRGLFKIVIQHCKDDIIIQLMRPVHINQSSIFCDFVDVKKSDLHRQVGKACVFRLACIYKDLKDDHPLMTIEFVKEKYPKYSHNLPVYETWSGTVAPITIALRNFINGMQPV